VPPSAKLREPPAPPDDKPAPEIRQGKLGELEIPLTDVHVVDAKRMEAKKWGPIR
jgi:hypothetical protein